MSEIREDGSYEKDGILYDKDGVGYDENGKLKFDRDKMIHDEKYPNLQRPNPAQASALGKIGGVYSGEERRRNKKIKEIAREFFNLPVKKGYKAFREAAKKYGYDDDTSLKEIFVAKTIINDFKKPNVWTLDKLVQILGEADGNEEVMGKLDEVLKAINEKANGTNTKTD